MNKKTFLLATLIILTLAANLACQAVYQIMPDIDSASSTPEAADSEGSKKVLAPTHTPTPETNPQVCAGILAEILNEREETYNGVSEYQPDTKTAEKVQVLVTYQISEDKLSEPVQEEVKAPLKEAQQDTETHREIWKLFSSLIPAEQRGMITSFSIMTDGPENYLADLRQDPQDPDEWRLLVDFTGAEDSRNLTYSLVEQYGRVLTLNTSQVSPNKGLLQNPGDENLLKTAEINCPHYFTGTGCANKEAYIEVFFAQFWADKYEDWSEAFLQDTPGNSINTQSAFYEKHREEFVSPTAVYSPIDDITASWARFALGRKPSGDTLSEQKVLFFYQYPELVALREHIQDETHPYEKTGQQLVSYRIAGDKLLYPELEPVEGDLQEFQEDTETHYQTWEYFARLFPAEQRTSLTTFSIMTDGPLNSLAYVRQTSEDAYTWNLLVDIADLEDTGKLTYTLLHEYGHLLTLQADQVPPDLDVYANPEDVRVFSRARNACPRYFTGEGCAEEYSFINLFFNQFWETIYLDWMLIGLENNDDMQDASLEAFFEAHEDQFVSLYAASAPEEDIAESWTYFLLTPKPSGNSLAEQKILFFYDYPELVSLRQHIRSQICQELSHP
ncbi:MAG: hypothetical protein JXA13_15580 [Anaerolineales bacterium]|nr:hypothetical protein [Anaerolineales bacterium]